MRTDVIEGILMVRVSDFVNELHGEVIPSVASTREYRRLKTLPGASKVGKSPVFPANMVRQVIVDYAHLPGARNAVREIDEKLELLRREQAWVLQSDVNEDTPITRDDHMDRIDAEQDRLAKDYSYRAYDNESSDPDEEEIRSLFADDFDA